LKATVGRIVHYFDSSGSGPYAAIVTAVGDEGWVDLTYFPPGAPAGTAPLSASAEHGTGGNSWCWPERV
jgi:hypothetical protein